MKKYINDKIFFFVIDDAKNYLLKKIQSFIEYGMSTKDENYLLTVSKNLGTIVQSFNGRI